jgi:hypothetical protein
VTAVFRPRIVPRIYSTGPRGSSGSAGAAGAAGADGAVPWIDAPIAGRHYPITGLPLELAPAELAGASGRGDLSPWLCTRTITPAAIGLQVTTGVTSAQVRILVYAADADGWPTTRIWDSGALDAATTNTYRENGTAVPTFAKGVLYWLGILSSSTAAVRCVPLGAAVRIGGIGATATTATYGSVVRRTGLTFASPPDPWGFAATQITNGIVPPQILARAA